MILGFRQPLASNVNLQSYLLQSLWVKFHVVVRALLASIYGQVIECRIFVGIGTSDSSYCILSTLARVHRTVYRY